MPCNFQNAKSDSARCQASAVRCVSLKSMAKERSSLKLPKQQIMSRSLSVSEYRVQNLYLTSKLRFKKKLLAIKN